MTRLFLDVEFNGYKGSLISLALVNKDTEWYETLGFSHLETIVPWVEDNVIPFLNKKPIILSSFRESLISFLTVNNKSIIIADWPEDIILLLSFIFDRDGKDYGLEFNFELIQSGNLNSETPHNALCDARALMKWYKENKDNKNG